MISATAIWRELLRSLLSDGQPVTQDCAGARGRTSYELLAHRTVWPMSKSVVLCPERKLDTRFVAAQAAWVLSGSNRLDEIAPFAKNLTKLSDDGVHLYGAYGPGFRQQLSYVLDTLAHDQASRQAVLTLWHPRPGPWKDVPAAIGLQYLIRDGTIHCVVSVRSSDAWFSMPYAVHTFSMTAAYVALMLRDRIGPLALGSLYFTAGSQYLYYLDREPATWCAYESIVRSSEDGVFTFSSEDAGKETTVIDREAMIHLTGEAFEVAPIDLAQFTKPDDLIHHLWAIAYSGWHKSAKLTPFGYGHVVVDGWLSETVQ